MCTLRRPALDWTESLITFLVSVKDRPTRRQCTMTCNAHNSVNNGSIWTIFGEYTLWMMLYLEYLYWRVMSWAVPKKSGHVVHGAILFPRLLMHSRQNDGILCIWMQKIGLKRDLRCINPCKSGDGSYLKKLTSPPKGGGSKWEF